MSDTIVTQYKYNNDKKNCLPMIGKVIYPYQGVNFLSFFLSTVHELFAMVLTCHVL